MSNQTEKAKAWWRENVDWDDIEVFRRRYNIEPDLPITDEQIINICLSETQTPTINKAEEESDCLECYNTGINPNHQTVCSLCDRYFRTPNNQLPDVGNKVESVESAAVNFANNYSIAYDISELSFIAGAEWQSQSLQSQTTELREVVEANTKLLKLLDAYGGLGFDKHEWIKNQFIKNDVLLSKTKNN
jgi:hypothetical protein